MSLENLIMSEGNYQHTHTHTTHKMMVKQPQLKELPLAKARIIYANRIK